jgi:hypothetical protein
VILAVGGRPLLDALDHRVVRIAQQLCVCAAQQRERGRGVSSQQHRGVRRVSRHRPRP